MRNLIDKNYIYGEIKLWKSSRKQNAVGAIVEAKADELFFRKFFSKNTSFFKTDGFPKLFETIKEIDKNNDTGFIGIIDADFRRIDNEKVIFENVFLTDGHDIEMMTINSPAWNEVVDFHTDRSKLNKFENSKKTNFKEHIFNLSKQIACVRYLSKKQNLELIFRTFKKEKPSFIDYSKFINIENLDIDTKMMILVIENKSSKHKLFENKPDLKLNLTKICEKNYEISEFCNGHDILNILAFSFKKAVASKNIAGTDIENQLIIAYRYDDFKKTELYKSLRNWEIKNSEYSLFID